MKKIRIAGIIIIIALFIVACSSKTDSTDESKKSSGDEGYSEASDSSSSPTPDSSPSPTPFTPEVTVVEPEPEKEITPTPDENNVLIKFAVGGSCLELNENQEKINKKIHDDGLDVNVFFYNVEYSESSGILDAFSGKTDYDIATTGIWMDSIGGTKFVSSGLFYDFSGYLASEEGKKLYQVFTENEWNMVRSGDAIYSFPSVTVVSDSGIYAYLYEDREIEDKTLNGLLQVCKTSPIDGRNKLFIMKSYYDVFSFANITHYLIAPFKIDEEKFVNPFKCPELLKVREEIAKENGKSIIYDKYESLSEHEKETYVSVIGQIPFVDFGSSKKCIMQKCMCNSADSSLGILNSSKNKEKALQLMYLIYTDKELADMINYACSAEIKDGVAVNIGGDIRGHVWGIGPFASPLESEKIKDRREAVLEWEKNACWDYVGFAADLTDEERNLLSKYRNEWNSWVENVEQEMPSQELIDGIDPIIEKLNKQFEEWKK